MRDRPFVFVERIGASEWTERSKRKIGERASRSITVNIESFIFNARGGGGRHTRRSARYQRTDLFIFSLPICDSDRLHPEPTPRDLINHGEWWSGRHLRADLSAELLMKARGQKPARRRAAREKKRCAMN